MVSFEEVFGTGLENVKAAGERVWNVVRSTAKQLREALDPKALLLGWSLLVTGAAITWCNQQTPPVNHAPQADITELVEFVQAGELRMPISDLLQMFGVEDPDGDTLSVEVISGPASIEDGYLVVNAGDDVEVKLKVSDGKWWEIILTLKLDVDNPTQVSDLRVNIVDRAVDGEPYGVYAWGMVDVEFKVEDPDWVSEVAVLVWDEEIPVDLDPAGIARLSFDTSGLLVWIYPVKVRVVDGAWNEKVIDLFDLKVYPYGEIIDPDSYGDFYRNGDRRDVMRWEYLRALNTLWLREWAGLTFWGEAQLVKDGDGNDVSGAGIVVDIDPSWIVLNADGNVWIEVKRVMDRVYNEKWVVPYGTYAFRLIVTVNTDEGPVNLSFPRLVAWPFE